MTERKLTSSNKPMDRTGSRTVPAEVYDRNYLLSDAVEGYAEYQKRSLSHVKNRQLEMLALTDGMTFLEVGCGRGEMLYHCAKRHAVVTGLDFSEDALKISTEYLAQYPGVTLCMGDCRNLPFKNDYFERVFSGDVVEHLGFTDGILLLQEMFRVLKPNGFMLIHTSPNTVFTKLIYPLGKWYLKALNSDAVKEMDKHLHLGKRVHIHEHSLFSLRRLARQAGLVNAKVWLAGDILRSSRHPLTRHLGPNPFIAFVAALGKFAIGRYFFSNDLYLKCYKPTEGRLRSRRCGILSEMMQKKRLEFFFRDVPKDTEILEVGSGDGSLKRTLLSRGWPNYTGIDICPPADIVGDICNWRALGLKRHRFDIIVAFELVEHVDCFHALHHLLKPDGLLFVTTPVPYMDWMCRILEACGINQRRTSPHINLVDLRKLPLFECVKFQSLAFIIQLAKLRKRLGAIPQEHVEKNRMKEQ